MHRMQQATFRNVAFENVAFENIAFGRGCMGGDARNVGEVSKPRFQKPAALRKSK